MTGSSSFDYRFPAYSMTVLDLAPAVTFAAIGAVIHGGPTAGSLDILLQLGGLALSGPLTDARQWLTGWGERAAVAAEQITFRMNRIATVETGLVHRHPDDIGSQGDPGDLVGTGGEMEYLEIPLFS